jgi:hypothetical protein
VVNYAGEPINLFWVNNFQANVEYVAQTKKAIRNNTDASINSYATHQFQARFLDDEAEAGVTFTKGPEDETIYVKYDPEKNEMYIEQITDAEKMIESLNADLEKCYEGNLSTEAMADCVSQTVVDELERMEETKSVMKYYQEVMGTRLHHYACQDKSFQPTTSTSSSKFRFLGDSYEADMFMESEHVKLYKIEEFLTADDCFLFKQHYDQENRNKVKGSLGKASFKMSASENPLWPIYARAMYFLNFKGGLNIQQEGQDPVELLLYPKGTEIKYGFPLF